MKYESSFSQHATSLSELFRLHEWFEIRLSPRTRVVYRANMCQTQKQVLFSVDNLCCRMFACFPVHFSIILFYGSLKTVLRMPSAIDKRLSGLAVNSDVLYSVMVFHMSFKFSSVSLYLFYKKILQVIFSVTFLTLI